MALRDRDGRAVVGKALVRQPLRAEPVYELYGEGTEGTKGIAAGTVTPANAPTLREMDYVCMCLSDNSTTARGRTSSRTTAVELAVAHLNAAAKGRSSIILTPPTR